MNFDDRCTFTAMNGAKLGWKPLYKPEHIIETADEEVELILNHLPEEDKATKATLAVAKAPGS